MDWFLYDIGLRHERVNGTRDGSRAAVTSNMERFVMIVNDWKPLTIITKHSILDAAAALDPPLLGEWRNQVAEHDVETWLYSKYSTNTGSRYREDC